LETKGTLPFGKTKKVEGDGMVRGLRIQSGLSKHVALLARSDPSSACFMDGRLVKNTFVKNTNDISPSEKPRLIAA
jgi:hypothetical protein